MSAPKQSVLFDAPGPKAKRRILLLNILGVLALLGLLAYLAIGLNSAGQLAPEKWNVFLKGGVWSNFILPGLLKTLQAAAISIVTSLLFGFIFGMGRLSHNKVIDWVSTIIVEFFRAVPVLLMMLFLWIMLARSGWVQPQDSPFYAVVIGLTLYNGSVIAELIRSGVHGLPRGQREAGIAIGLTRGQSLRLIEIPQALTAMLPALISQFIVILKDSALGYIINFNELLFNGKLVGTGNSNMFQSLVIVAAIFIILNFALSKLASVVSSRLSSRGQI
ncbi:amino acid ABC transporter permease [Glutamicibacter protophormiae]|uniref:Glutamate transport system permease protein n=1 Tax=Glutamicibacter protophormiae TaxID=37930 RepID=A0ABS4XUM3_GLUPR|nr:amino acid ABC transporter permease [Glutamicibacter protophormiae]MBP2400223.1 glutamate transport system permease protein [Glutamicibacter protophormiae]QRQ77530.1 amino acid ABC transporter permease [Glutamicibacter protophormiae]WPR63517.1 amino acid ABC transporter permease [Glutamicibacter protophormiae]WPR67013.1 amino acid ABC transporter permease [Glutamicibacter protophormiae]GGL74313.1 glutamate ABC transporter permease [Glutamicibacter protophormiae]